MDNRIITGRALVPGTATSSLMISDTGLSFLGGVNSSTGIVIDTHHPLCGQSVSGKILAIPSGRGSCAGSLALFELLMNGNAPSALIFCEKETILTLGVIIAAEIFGIGIPVVQITKGEFDALSSSRFVAINGSVLTQSLDPLPLMLPGVTLPDIKLGTVALEPIDEFILAGKAGEAARVALRIVLRTAEIEGASKLVDVDMAHIDGCFYEGPGTLQFAEKLLEMGAQVKIHSTMNALCVDRDKWKAQGVDRDVGTGSDALADAYLAMGVLPTYTCAPYLLDPSPQFGQQIAWAESNAVVFANSVLGARTMKYPDYLDILVALTGRAPYADCHRLDARAAQIILELPHLSHVTDAFFPLLGYLVGQISPNQIPLITGLEHLPVTRDDLKAFGASFATTSAVAMFHILGHTPEAMTVPHLAPAATKRSVLLEEIIAAWKEINPTEREDIQLVSLGNPHFSLSECVALAEICRDRTKSPTVEMIVTIGRAVFDDARKAGIVGAIESFGGKFIYDTCWCLIRTPVIDPQVRSIVTNSGKYAHYGPAVIGKPVYLASLSACVDAACTGSIDLTMPEWFG